MTQVPERGGKSTRNISGEGAIAPGSPGRPIRRTARVAVRTMDRIILGILAALTIAGTSRASSRPPLPEMGRYKAHVATLASEEFGGRRGPGAAKAAAYIAREFRRLGLEPLFDGRSFQEITDSRGGVLGRNVGAKLVG